MPGQQQFRSVIEIADHKDKKLSFINLVEAFVLAGIRREHNISLPKVRKAVRYLRHFQNPPTTCGGAIRDRWYGLVDG